MVDAHSLQEILSIPYAFEALLRRLTVIGEAARRVSADRQHELPEIPWRHGRHAELRRPRLPPR
jgi:uncharacterized protein with HEPN domain